MKKIILSALVLSMAFAVQAQETPEKKGDRHHSMDKRKHHRGGMDMQKLNLTEEQKASFKSQHENYRKQMEELKKNQTITVGESKTRAENIRKEHKAKIDGILTSDQKAQLQKMKAEGKEKHAAMAKQRGERMKTELGLTDEQSAKLQSNRKAMGEKMKALRENKSLTDEQKKEQMKELMKQQKENMKSVLTEEQLKKLQETKHKRPEGGDRRKHGMKEKETI